MMSRSGIGGASGSMPRLRIHWSASAQIAKMASMSDGWARRTVMPPGSRHGAVCSIRSTLHQRFSPTFLVLVQSIGGLAECHKGGGDLLVQVSPALGSIAHVGSKEVQRPVASVDHLTLGFPLHQQSLVRFAVPSTHRVTNLLLHMPLAQLLVSSRARVQGQYT